MAIKQIALMKRESKKNERFLYSLFPKPIFAYLLAFPRQKTHLINQSQIISIFNEFIYFW